MITSIDTDYQPISISKNNHRKIISYRLLIWELVFKIWKLEFQKHLNYWCWPWREHRNNFFFQYWHFWSVLEGFFSYLQQILIIFFLVIICNLQFEDLFEFSWKNHHIINEVKIRNLQSGKMRKIDWPKSFFLLKCDIWLCVATVKICE